MSPLESKVNPILSALIQELTNAVLPFIKIRVNVELEIDGSKLAEGVKLLPPVDNKKDRLEACCTCGHWVQGNDDDDECPMICELSGIYTNSAHYCDDYQHCDDHKYQKGTKATCQYRYDSTLMECGSIKRHDNEDDEWPDCNFIGKETACPFFKEAKHLDYNDEDEEDDG